MLKLRSYQQEAIDNVFNFYPHKSNKLLLSMATGLGKSVSLASIANQLIEQSGKKVLVIAHREELLEQLKDEFLFVNKQLKWFIDQGDRKITEKDYKKANVIIASVQTIGRFQTNRIKIYNPEDFINVTIDEAHTSASSSYVRVLEYFGLSKHPPLPENPPEILKAYKAFKGKKKGEVEWHKNPHNWNLHCLLLGVTATPFRTKAGESLKFIFDELVYKYDLSKAIQDDWLSDIRYKEAVTGTNVGSIKMQQGDYAVGELSNTINTPERNEFIVETFKKETQEGRSLIFTVSKEHNQDLKKAFDKEGIVVEIVDSDTPKHDRKQIVRDFKDGKISALLNVGIFKEGFNVPDIRNILMARPTQSMIFYVQAIGRGTRKAEGKDHCTVIDFVDNFARNNPLNLKYIFNIPEGTDIAKKTLKKQLEQVEESGGGNLSIFAPPSGEQYQIIDRGLIFSAIKFVEENYIEKSEFNWIKILNNKWFMPLPNNTVLYSKGVEIKLPQSRFVVEKNWKEEWELSFQYLQYGKKMSKDIGIYPDVEDLDARINGVLIENNIPKTLVVRTSRWQNGIISDKQKYYIQGLLNAYRRNMNISSQDLETMTKGQAGILINILKFNKR